MGIKGYDYHHIGIPTTEVKEGESYSERFKFYSSGYDNKFRIQWHRFEKDSPFPDLIKTQPHVAFQVPNMEKALEGEKVLVEPFYPLEGIHYCVAFIECEGAPVELIETDATPEELESRAGTA